MKNYLIKIIISPYYYDICDIPSDIDEDEKFLLSCGKNGRIMIDELKLNKAFKKRKISIMDTLRELEHKGIVKCTEMRYDFKNTKISTGLNGINRIFLPSSKIYPTLVASDTNDYVATEELHASTIEAWKDSFMKNIYEQTQGKAIKKSNLNDFLVLLLISS